MTATAIKFRLRVWRGVKDLYDEEHETFSACQEKLRELIANGLKNASAQIEPMYNPPLSMEITITPNGKMFDKATGKRIT